MEQDNIKSRDGFLFKQTSELEILISAAIVFAAFKLMDVVPALLTTLLNTNISNTSPFLVIIALVALFLSTLLPLSIVIHFILRFYWLSLVGLKTAYKQQHLEKLTYAHKYLNFITRKNDLTRHIEFIDKLCSTIFAFSFLAVFVFCLTTFSIFIIIGVFLFLIEVVFEGLWLQWVITFVLNMFILLCLVTFIDFITVGELKKIKKRWFVKIYYPISRMMGVITLSFFYRPLYYTFITNTPKYIAAIALPCYLIMAVFILNAGFYESRLYAEDSAGLRMGEAAAMTIYYKHNFTNNTIINYPFIDEYFVDKNYIPLYIPVTEQLDDFLVDNCANVIPLNERGIYWRKYIKIGALRNGLPGDFDYSKNAENVVSCLKENVVIMIDDSVYHNQSFRFFGIHNPEKTTFLTTLDVEHLPKGNHVIKLKFSDQMDTGLQEIGFYKTNQ